MRNFILALVFVAMAFFNTAFAQVKSIGKEHQVEQVIVELTAENSNRQVVVPVDTLQTVGSWSASVTEGKAEKTNWGFSFSVYRIQSNRVFLRMIVNTNSGSRIEKRFPVSRARRSEYEFEQGVKIKAYFKQSN